MKIKETIEKSGWYGTIASLAFLVAKLATITAVWSGKEVPKSLISLVMYPEKIILWASGMPSGETREFMAYLLTIAMFWTIFFVLNLIYFRYKEGKNIGNIVAVIAAATMIAIRLYYGIEGFIGFAHPYWIAFLVYAIVSLSLIVKATAEEYTIFLRHTKLFEEDPPENWGRLKFFFWVYFFNPVSVVKIFLRGSKCVAFSIYCHYRPRSSIC